MKILLLLLLGAMGYNSEWRHVSNPTVALAEAIPAGKYAWRPAPGVRSTNEVFMHIAISNSFC
jgi:hypothetical protein